MGKINGDIKSRNFRVFIVESPSDEDLYNNRYEGVILKQALALTSIESTHKIVTSQRLFDKSLDNDFNCYIEEFNANPYSIANLYPPVLHISAHGNKTGIQLTDNKFITWTNLETKLVTHNKKINNNLVLCLSSCYSYGAGVMAMTPGQLPYFAFISSDGSPTWSETTIAYLTFYFLLSKGYEFDKAIEAMKISSGNSSFQIHYGAAIKEWYIGEIKKIIKNEKTPQSS